MRPKIQIPEAFDFLFEKARVKVAHGGRGGAKSESIGRYLLIKGMEQPENIVCGREFQSSIRDSVHSMLASLIESEGLSSAYRVLDTEIRGTNGTLFTFVGVRRNVSNIKSMHNIKRFWGEEAQTFSRQSLDIIFPTIRAPGSELIFSMNADLEEDPAYQMLILNPPPDSIVRKINYDQNPYFPEELRAQMEHMKRTDYQKYLHIWEGFPKAAVEGAIYANALQKARDEGRIGAYPHDPRYPVSVFADIGWADNTSLWFLQYINHQPRVIDCYQNQFEKTAHYVSVLQDRKYVYDRIVLPHDANNEHANADRTWLQIFKQSFPNANVYAGKRQAVELRLEATKNMFDTLCIDKEKCSDGLSALAHYHFAVDPDTGKSTREPFHGPESNYADAFGYMCLEAIEARRPPRPKPRAATGWRAQIGMG